MTNAVGGLRFNLIDRLLISGNVLVKLDNGGLCANVVSQISVSCTLNRPLSRKLKDRAGGIGLEDDPRPKGRLGTWPRQGAGHLLIEEQA